MDAVAVLPLVSATSDLLVIPLDRDSHICSNTLTLHFIHTCGWRAFVPMENFYLSQYQPECVHLTV